MAGQMAGGEHSSQLGTRTGSCTGGHTHGSGRSWADGLGQKWVLSMVPSGSWWDPASQARLEPLHVPGGSQDKSSPVCERGFPCTASPVQEGKTNKLHLSSLFLIGSGAAEVGLHSPEPNLLCLCSLHSNTVYGLGFQPSPLSRL